MWRICHSVGSKALLMGGHRWAWLLMLSRARDPVQKCSNENEKIMKVVEYLLYLPVQCSQDVHSFSHVDDSRRLGKLRGGDNDP